MGFHRRLAQKLPESTFQLIQGRLNHLGRDFLDPQLKQKLVHYPSRIARLRSPLIVVLWQ